MDENNQNFNRPNSRRAAKVMTILFLLLVLAIATAGYFYWQWNTLRSNPTISGAEESQRLAEEVGKIMLLPDETPTVATITDLAALSDQPFFANAQVGYKVLVYTLARKAVLYDPFNRRIIEVGPVDISDEAVDNGTTSQNTQATPDSN